MIDSIIFKNCTHRKPCAYCSDATITQNIFETFFGIASKDILQTMLESHLSVCQSLSVIMTSPLFLPQFCFSSAALVLLPTIARASNLRMLRKGVCRPELLEQDRLGYTDAECCKGRILRATFFCGLPACAQVPLSSLHRNKDWIIVISITKC